MRLHKISLNTGHHFAIVAEKQIEAKLLQQEAEKQRILPVPDHR